MTIKTTMTKTGKQNKIQNTKGSKNKQWKVQKIAFGVVLLLVASRQCKTVCLNAVSLSSFPTEEER